MPTDTHTLSHTHLQTHYYCTRPPPRCCVFHLSITGVSLRGLTQEEALYVQQDDEVLVLS